VLNIDNIIQKIEITNYRGINDLCIDNLSNINIFVGSNNSGKTSILEAIKLMSAPNDIGQFVSIALQRAQVSEDQRQNNLVNYLISLFQKCAEDDCSKCYNISMSIVYNNTKCSYEVYGDVGSVVTTSGETKETLDIAIGTSKNGGKKSYTQKRLINGVQDELISEKNQIFNAIYLHSSVNYYYSCVKFLSEYIISQGKIDILRILKSFDNHIEDIGIVGSDIYLYNSISGSLPLFSYGQGMQKALLLTSLIAYCKNGIILIDEIDNAIHVSAFKDVFKWFLDACKENNVQAFVSTHSIEVLDAILNVAHDSEQDDMLRVITLRKSEKNNSTKCKVRTGKEAYYDRENFRMELRI